MPPAIITTLALCALLAAPALAAGAEQPNADQLLRGMSAKLAAARTFTFEATRPVVPATTTVVATTLPAGYIRVIPTGSTTVVHGGYTCRYVGGVHYRPVMYGGETVYVVVR